MWSVCRLCGQSLPSSARSARVCTACYQDLPVTPPAVPLQIQQRHRTIDHVFCPYLYQSPVSNLIQQLKYHRHYSHARLLAWLFVCKLQEQCTVIPEQVVPVPLHRHRLRHRGFNQSFELARLVCAALQQKHVLHTEYCQRTRHTAAQTGLNRLERQQNLKDAFAVRHPLSCTHLVIFDDVLTTGSTIASLARALKTAGAQRVDVWVMAFAPLIEA